MPFTPGWNVTAGEAPTEAKWDEIGENLDYLYYRIVPSGIIVMWSGSIATIPTGWVLCDGSNSTPDLRGKFIVGAGGAYAVAAQGGEATHALSSSEMPVHAHGVSDPSHAHGVYDPGHFHDGGVHFGGGGGSQRGNLNTATDGGTPWYTGNNGVGIGIYGATTNISITNSGGNAAHENRPPYYALAFIMKI